MKLPSILLFLGLSSTTLFAGEPEKVTTCDVSVRGKEIEIVKGSPSPDLSLYVVKVRDKIRDNWFTFVPKSAFAPQFMQGCTVIEFTVKADGKVASMRLAEPSGYVDMDRAAWGGITASIPFEPFPKPVAEKEITLRLRFLYNPDKTAPSKEQKKSPRPS